MPLLVNLCHLEADDLELKGELPVEELDLHSRDEMIRVETPLELDRAAGDSGEVDGADPELGAAGRSASPVIDANILSKSRSASASSSTWKFRGSGLAVRGAAVGAPQTPTNVDHDLQSWMNLWIAGTMR